MTDDQKHLIKHVHIELPEDIHEVLFIRARRCRCTFRSYVRQILIDSATATPHDDTDLSPR